MLAYMRGSRARLEGLDRRVGSSLGLFAGVTVPSWRDGDRIAWQLRHASELPSRAQRKASNPKLICHPALLPGGIAVQVHGWIDNCAELAELLGCASGDQALVYGHAVRTWGDDADARIHGDYCAVYDDPAQPGLRLSRSAMAGPPLYYMAQPGAIMAASVPRVLEAAGLPRELNRKRIADSLYFNLTDTESYLKGCFKVPYGTVIHVSAESRRSHRYWDPLSISAQPPASPEDYVAEADRLLEEACRRYQGSARNPGVLLSGGLDSSNVAARLLRGWPVDRPLHSFTYVPLAGHGQPDIPGGLADEGPAVRAFAAMHPQIEPHFVDNREIQFDHRLEDMFLAMGTGTVNLAAFFRYHGLFEAASSANCDMLLSSDFGNFTYSSAGSWAPSEFLRTGQWGQLWQALRKDRLRPGGMLWRLFSRAVVPSLPDPLWKLAMRLRGKPPVTENQMICALRDEALREFDVEARAERAGTRYLRALHGWRADLIRDNFGRGDVEGSDMIQGWAQLYEVSMRDPTSYRPLVEFCLGLPTGMFMRDGIDRWLARELGRGLMPEAQRTMPGHGEHNSDWYLRFTPRRADMRREIEAIRNDPVLGDMIDTDDLLDSIDNWPEAQTIDGDVYFRHAFRLPRAVAMARYVRFMTGRNLDQEMPE